MLIKDWEFDHFLKSLLNYSAIMIHGPDRGKVTEKVNNIIETIKSSVSNSLEIKDILPDDILKSKNHIYELAYQKSFLSELVIIKVNMDLIKVDKDFLNFVECLNLEKSNLIILESYQIKGNSDLLNMFKLNKKLALLNCYQDTDKSIENSIIRYSKIYGLKLDADSVSFLSKRLGNDTMVTKNEIKKLATYANGEPISFKEILKSIGDNSTISLFDLSDALGIKNKYEINYLYERCLLSGANSLSIIRTVYRHINMLLQAKSDKINDIKLIKPYIHFSRHKLVSQQINIFTIDKLRVYIQDLYSVEILCKLNASTNNIILKKLLLSISTY